MRNMERQCKHLQGDNSAIFGQFFGHQHFKITWMPFLSQNYYLLLKTKLLQ